jgi:uracil phosphoribosyltransferase
VSRVCLIDHPLVQHKLTYIRDKNTNSKEFRELVDEVALLMAYEVTRNLRLEDTMVETPIGPCPTRIISGQDVGVIAILRAGLGMIGGILKLIPNAKVGHIGLYRDPETLQPVEYYCKLPADIAQRELIVVDPMLATGGSAAAGIQAIKDRGGRRIRLMCLIAAPEGIQTVQERHPDVDIYVAAIDECLNSQGYIVPGLGDAGDRLFGTK